MKKTLFVANWKMQPESAKEAQALWGGTKRAVARARRIATVVCPPFPYLHPLSKTRSTSVLLGAQDISLYDRGSHTGEVSPAMLKDLDVRYVIVGHSERRNLGETNAIVARKTKLALAGGLRPVVCVGEQERSHHGEHLGSLEEQIRHSLSGVPRSQAKNLVVAYEPLWAVGKSFKYAMQPGEIHEATLFIRKILAKLFGRGVGISIPVLYGGAVEEENIVAVVSAGEVDGVLVGHASLDARLVSRMVRALESAR